MKNRAPFVSGGGSGSNGKAELIGSLALPPLAAGYFSRAQPLVAAATATAS